MQYVHLDCTAPACGWETRLELKARFCLGHFKLSWDGWQLVSYTPPPFLQNRSFGGNHILHLFLYCCQLFVVIAYIEIAAAVVFGWHQTNPKKNIIFERLKKWIFGYSSEEGTQIYSTYCCKPMLKKAATNRQSYTISLSSNSTEETGLLCKFIRSYIHCLNSTGG